MHIIPAQRLVVAQSLSPRVEPLLGRLGRLGRPGRGSWLLVTGRPARLTNNHWHGQIRLLLPEPPELEDLPDIGLFPVSVLLQFAITEHHTFRVTNVVMPPSLRRQGLTSEFLIRTHAALAVGSAWQFDPPTSAEGRAWQSAMSRRLTQ